MTVLLSSCAGGACSPAQANLSGTSMATPHAAGHTALVRQYLRTGFYPTGSPADAAAAPFTPSGMLLKVRCHIAVLDQRTITCCSIGQAMVDQSRRHV